MPATSASTLRVYREEGETDRNEMTTEQDVLVEDFDKRMSAALRAAVGEAEQQGMPDLGIALDLLRVSTLQWRANALERLKSLGIYSMSPEQYNLWMDLMAKALAERAVQEAKERAQHRQRAWWEARQVQLAAVAAVVALTISAISALYGLFFGGTHALFYTLFNR